MTNKDFIKSFIAGEKEYGACNHLGYTGKTLWNYSTVICEVDRKNKCADLNTRRYSNTTGRIQSMLRRELEASGYSINEYIGKPANMWNYGYMGAEKWKVKDFKPAFH